MAKRLLTPIWHVIPLRDMLEDHFDREIVCECQILNDEREIRKEALRRQFGVDFKNGEVGLVD